MPNHYLPHRPQEVLEIIARISSENSPFNNHNDDLLVITCCDPRIADVITGVEAMFIRTPGADVNPQWSGIRKLVGATKVTAFLCHNQCLAHTGSMEDARRAVQWARHAFWHALGGNVVFLSGNVDVETRYVSILDDRGMLVDTTNLLRSTPFHTREAIKRLIAVNGGRPQQKSTGSTTLLHPPIGVLAVSVGGALNHVRERDLAYVVDHLGQDPITFGRQTNMIGDIVMNNAVAMGLQPHLIVVGNEDDEGLAKRVFEQTTTSLTRLDDEHCFTAELAIRSKTGQFEQISMHTEICAKKFGD